MRLRLELKTKYHVLGFNQFQLLKPYIEFNTQKRIETVKNEDNDGNALYKLMSYAIYKEENIWNGHENKAIYVAQHIWQLVAIRKSKVALMLNKPTYIEICILELSKVSIKYQSSIMITLKINMKTNQDYHLQTMIV